MQIRKDRATKKRKEIEEKLRLMLSEYTITKFQYNEKIKYVRDNAHIIFEAFAEMNHSFKGQSAKIRELEKAIGIVTAAEAAGPHTIDAAPEKSNSAVALYQPPETETRLMAHQGSVGSLSVGVPRASEREAARAKEQQARALVKRLADERKKREQQIKLK